MKTIKSLKEITTLEVGDVVMFGDLEHVVYEYYRSNSMRYYLGYPSGYNGVIFEELNLKKRDFTEELGIDADCTYDFPETKSLEALTAIVSALFKEYEKQNELPKTWKEFCKRNPIKKEECWIECFDGATLGYADARIAGKYREPDMDRNMCTSKQEAEAFLALMQLRQLRKAYVGDWKPNGKQQYYGVVPNIYGLDIIQYGLAHRSMSFPTKELATQFLTNFKDLLEIAKPLL